MDRDRLAGPFGQSIQNWVRTLDAMKYEMSMDSFGNLDERLDNIAHGGPSVNVEEAFRLALRSVAYVQADNAEMRLSGAIRACGSPIEAVLLLALVTLCSQSRCSLQLKTRKLGRTGKHRIRCARRRFSKAEDCSASQNRRVSR